MKSNSLRLCLTVAILCFLGCAGTLTSCRLNCWLFFVFANVLYLTGMASLMLSLWVHWCCPPDPVEIGTGFCPE